jgi:FkbM family methyltransferase
MSDESLSRTELKVGPRSSERKSWRIGNSVRRLWSARSHYTYKSDWLYSIYHRALLHFPRLPLSGRQKLRQVWLNGIPEPFYIRMGTTDWYVLEEIFIDEVYEPVIRRAIHDVRTVVDLGANTGFSVRLWQQAYPSACIIAVEPDSANLQMCRRNAFAGTGQTDQLCFVQACVGGRARMVSLDRNGGAWRFRVQEAAPSDETLEALTLPEILERCQVNEAVDLLKCDIEGAEAEVFSNCAEWINRVRNLVIEVHSPYTKLHLIADLQRAGWLFEIYHCMACADDSELLFLKQIPNVPTG